jgi:hypothetical protein
MTRHIPILALALLAAAQAHAGRPLSVEDADTGEAGSGHFDTWVARDPGGGRSWTLSPAWSPRSGLELSGALTRDRTAAVTSTQLAAKVLFSAPQDGGCNSAGLAGITHSRGVGNTPLVSAIVTCNGAWGAAHVNLGAQRNPGTRTVPTWGAALERSFGSVTASLEAFGQRHGKPVFQVGARTLLTGQLQLDGTIGRQDRTSLFSLGLVHPF